MKVMSVLCNSSDPDALLGFGGGSVPIYLTNVRCIGGESSLLDCPSEVAEEGSCRRSEDAGVRCLNGEL